MESFRQREEEMRKLREQKGEQATKKTERRSVFMEAYAWGAQRHMEKFGTTQRQLAVISSKNHYHSTMNPLAQYQNMLTVEDILAAPEVAWPLTRPMCSPVGDGAAAAIVCSEDFARKLAPKYVAEVAACCLASGEDRETDEETTLSKLARKAYDKAGIGPQDLSLAEVHDATAFGELSSVEQLGICTIGEGGPFAEAGNTKLGGKIPVNVSGGLESQGHPVGATGCRQVVELFWHLTGRAGARQVPDAKVGLAQNAGGSVGGTEAALSVTILKR
jgi:acetyl-CoA acetyltransferase